MFEFYLPASVCGPPRLKVLGADDVFAFLRYLNAIQTMCPHILRYLTTAVITNKDVRKRRQVLKDLVKVIQQVSSLTMCQITATAGGGLSSAHE